MPQLGGKPKKSSKKSSDSKRHFTVVVGGKEHGLYVSSTPSSAARKAVTKLCSSNKKKKVEFCVREITQGSKKKTYGTYVGYIEKLKEPIKLKGRVIKYKPVVKLSKKKSEMKGGGLEAKDFYVNNPDVDPKFKYTPSIFGKHRIFFGEKISLGPNDPNKYFSLFLADDGSFGILIIDPSTNQFKVYEYDISNLTSHFSTILFPKLGQDGIPNPDNVVKFSDKMKEQLKFLIKIKEKKIILNNFIVVGEGQDIDLTFDFMGKIFTNKMNQIQHKNSYLLLNETTNLPQGNFENLLYSQSVRNNVRIALNVKQKIVIKIGEDGTLSDLLGNTSLPYQKNKNLSNNSKLNQNSFQKYMRMVEKNLF